MNAVKNEEASQISKLNEEINALKKRLESGQGPAADTRSVVSIVVAITQ